jgi:S1-C subfamily serine protease
MRRTVLLTSLSIAVLALACGGGQPEPASPSNSTSVSSGSPPDLAAKPITSLKRSQVRFAIGRGVGAFLQNVTLDENPAFKEGKFYGWRIRSVNAEWGLDFRPGDVVTRVNGMGLEKPDDADAALRSLDKAPALRVEYERDGKSMKLELPITED